LPLACRVLIVLLYEANQSHVIAPVRQLQILRSPYESPSSRTVGNMVGCI
jgi:hypothetical protein